jgi:hypothetical protein
VSLSSVFFVVVRMLMWCKVRSMPEAQNEVRWEDGVQAMPRDWVRYRQPTTHWHSADKCKSSMHLRLFDETCVWSTVWVAVRYIPTSLILMIDTDIAFLEQKLKRLEGVVQDISSCTNSGQQDRAAESRMDTSFSEPLWSTLPTLGRIDSTFSFPPDHRSSIDTTQTQSSDDSGEDLLETVGSKGQEISARGRELITNYRGQTTGVEVFRILRGLCNTFLGLKTDSDNAAWDMANALDSAFPTHSNSTTSLAKICFSSEASIKRWIDIAFAQAFNLWPFIDREDLDFHAQRLIEQGHTGQGRSDDDHLGLVHAVIALGQRHDVELVDTGSDKNSGSNPPG